MLRRNLLFCGSGAWTLVFGLSASSTTRAARQAQVCYFAPTMCKLRLRRSRLSAYRASSARLINSSADSPGVKFVHPAENETSTNCPLHSALSPLNRLRTCRTASGLHSGSKTRNSSPPRRTAKSEPRMALFNRSAKLLINSSPAGCPKLSLTCFRSSKSSARTVSGWPFRVDRDISCARRSSPDLRLYSPVSGSSAASL